MLSTRVISFLFFRVCSHWEWCFYRSCTDFGKWRRYTSQSTGTEC